MMYYINKIVGWVTSPLGIAFLGFAVGWVMCRRGGRLARIGKWLIGIAAAFLWLMSCYVTTRFVGVRLERDWSQDGAMHGSIEGLSDAEAIIVLGGGVGAHAECHAPELYSGADRVWQGARLYNAKKSCVSDLKVYCTGGGCEYAAVPLLVDLGVPREAIWFSEEPRNTEEEARLIKTQFASKKPRIFLVTSAWHMLRAKMLFDRAGFDVIPAPTDFEMNCAAEEPVGFGDFIPAPDALLRNSSALKEWVARFGYWMLGR
ncbi:MAG: YdcF family protein [Kiritimatiellia bacterium]